MPPMKRSARLPASTVLLALVSGLAFVSGVPSVAQACPMGGSSAACSGSFFSLLGYGAAIVGGLLAGIASIAFERRPPQ
jgi:hypothetical protein